MTALISVLIVNYNSSQLLRESLDALGESTIADGLEIIVVDNASADFDVAAMTAAYPAVTFIPEPVNTTYTGGNNRAFERANADLILMLNPDTRVEPEALERAVAHLAEEPQLAGLSAYLIEPDGRLQRYYRRLPRLRDVPVMLFERPFRQTARGRRFLMLEEPFDAPTPVEDPPGAFILCRRAALGGLLLDPGYFNFMSDLELCERMGRAGPLMVFSDVRCQHHRAGAGVGTREPALRLRLYHDLTWGMRRYFAPRTGRFGWAALQVLLAAYWLTRAAWVSVRAPRMTYRAVATGVAALIGRPPDYGANP